jgi:ribosomal small subunit protein bTHX
MGKGDKKSKRGKIIMGSTGVSRQKKRKPAYVPPKPKATVSKPKKEDTEVIEVAVPEKKTTTAKKPAAKKTTAKKTTAAKKTTTAKKKAEDAEENIDKK